MFALSGSVSCHSPWPLLHKVLRLGGGFRLIPADRRAQTERRLTSIPDLRPQGMTVYFTAGCSRAALGTQNCTRILQHSKEPPCQGVNMLFRRVMFLEQFLPLLRSSGTAS